MIVVLTEQVREFWDAHAATFDEEPDHGLRDPVVRAAWTDLLVPLMPPAPASVVDLGSGTGSLAVLLAGAGYDVRGWICPARWSPPHERRLRRRGWL